MATLNKSETDTNEAICLWGAMRLDEILEDIRTIGTVPSSIAAAHGRLDRWRLLLHVPSSALLAAWSHAFRASPADLLRALGADRAVLGACRRRNWMIRSEQIIGLYELSECDVHADIPDPQFKLCSVAWPWLQTARKELKQRCAALWPKNATNAFDLDYAQDILYRRLLIECTNLLQRTVSMEVNIARLRGLLPGSTPSERFDSFCHQMTAAASGLRFWNEYVSLARLLTELCDRWLSSSEIFLRRLDHDWDDLHRYGLLTRGTGRLEAVIFAGDSHASGETVAIIKFSSGQQLVYKPRPITGEHLLHDIVSWLGRNGQPNGPRLPQFINRGEYGWAEYISSTQATLSHDDTDGYYYRCGALLAVADVFGIRDLINENIIAHNAAPVVVDAECMWWPLHSPSDRDHLWHDSLLCCGLLPGMEVERGIDLSGICGQGGALRQLTINAARNWNTDQVWFERSPAVFDSGLTRPMANADLSQYADALVSGFQDTYHVITTHRDGLLSDTILTGAGTSLYRFIPRASAAYQAVISEMLHPNLLRDALDGEALIARLMVPDRWQKRLFAHEREAVWRGDIPMFWIRPHSTSIWLDDRKEIPHVFHRSGIWRFQRQLSVGQDCRYLAKSRELIRLTLKCQPARIVWPSSLDPSANLRDLCATFAEQIGAYLIERSTDNSDGMTWFHRTEDASARMASQDTVEFLQTDLYAGLSGLLIFLARLSDATGSTTYRQMAERVFAQLAKTVVRAMNRSQRLVGMERHPNGGFEGIPSVLYALLHAADFGDASTLHGLCTLACEHSFQWIARDRSNDLMAGTAGLIPVLAAIGRMFPEIPYHEPLRAAGNHLLALADDHDSGKSWKTNDSVALTGFAHGASGIAVALHCAWRLTGEDRFRMAGEKALDWERSDYLEQYRNWRDRRSWLPGESTQEDRCALAWCHGSPGIGLARLAVLEHSTHTGVLDDLTHAAESTAAAIPLMTTDSLCHGAFGNVEILYTMGWRWRPDLLPVADQRLRDLLSRVHNHGFRFPGCTYPLSFMLGLSGIGYSLLRVASGGTLPCVLLLEPPEPHEMVKARSTREQETTCAAQNN